MVPEQAAYAIATRTFNDDKWGVTVTDLLMALPEDTQVLVAASCTSASPT